MSDDGEAGQRPCRGIAFCGPSRMLPFWRRSGARWSFSGDAPWQTFADGRVTQTKAAMPEGTAAFLHFTGSRPLPDRISEDGGDDPGRDADQHGIVP